VASPCNPAFLPGCPSQGEGATLAASSLIQQGFVPRQKMRGPAE
jgi:hypothetical protein